MGRSAPDSAAVQGIQAARLWARLTGGLGRSLEGQEEEGAGDWVDLDEESLGDSDSAEEPAVLGEREEDKKGTIGESCGKEEKSSGSQRWLYAYQERFSRCKGGLCS